MITVEQATQSILSQSFSFGTQPVPLYRATGRVLHEDLTADRDFPPFDRVSMDGIAIVFQQFEQGRRSFQIKGMQAAGAPQMKLEHPANCLEAMTGAMLPDGTDTVVRYEDLEIADGVATILIADIVFGQNIHRRGTDRLAGSVIVEKGRVVSPSEIGVAATIGKQGLLVGKHPQVAIISTGDELVDIGEMPLPHQIRKSNVHNLATAVRLWGIEPNLFHLPDDKDVMRALLPACLENYQALLLSGGVSAGKLDFLPEVLTELGVEKSFHQVSQRPGKPFWFGRTIGAVVFALPGNPISTFMCLHRYFRPWLRKSMGLPPFAGWCAALGATFHFKAPLTYFLQVKTQIGQDGRLTAMPIEGRGSGDLANLVDADAFMELPKDRQVFEKGEVFPVYFFRVPAF